MEVNEKSMTQEEWLKIIELIWIILINLLKISKIIPNTFSFFGWFFRGLRLGCFWLLTHFIRLFFLWFFFWFKEFIHFLRNSWQFIVSFGKYNFLWHFPHKNGTLRPYGYNGLLVWTYGNLNRIEIHKNTLVIVPECPVPVKYCIPSSYPQSLTNLSSPPEIKCSPSLKCIRSLKKLLGDSQCIDFSFIWPL